MAEDIILNADLYDNTLTGDPNDYVARPRNTGTVYNADIASRMASKYPGYEAGSLTQTLDLADQEKMLAVAEGKNQVDKTGSRQLTIAGPFKGADAQFDSSLNSMGVMYTMSDQFRELLKTRVKVRVHGIAQTGPIVNYVIDAVTENSSKEKVIESLTITSGGALTIAGSNLKIQGSDDSVGVFFVPSIGEPKKVSVLISNMPSQLIVQMPTLDDGIYTLRVTTQFVRNGKMTKAPRSYDYPVPLKVGQGSSEEDGPQVQ